ncbi:1-phosphofructokinase family hexose kinase [uncultured Arthrobacter sp.]|uniref:1-phosphofructokinase family hexose kinase n=1 Tax=uncultured Arthrobacter sp. TaxID=114050 RepID=UPI0025F59949|nr:hexose kinase [uncultured Arthrobacter sp.]
MTGPPPAGTAGTVVTVTPNPALDETYTVPAIVLGTTHRVAAPAVRAGGKGVNVSRVLHQQGYPTLALAAVGGPTGEQYTAELASSGIPSVLEPATAPTRRSLAFHDSTSGSTSLFNETGNALEAAEWARLWARIDDALPGAGCVVGSGSLPPGAPTDFYAALVRRCAGAGVRCIIDTSGPGLLRAAAAGADLLKPNAGELREATGEADPARGARLLLGLGARRVFVSWGEDGMLALTADAPDRHLRAALPEPLHGNATGAGDAAVAALATLLAAGSGDVSEMLRRATAWSAAAVLMPTAGDIHPDHVRLAAEVSVTRHDDASPTGQSSPGTKPVGKES